MSGLTGVKRNRELAFPSESTLELEGFAGLPHELLLQIFNHLAPKDLEAATCVCRSWNQVGKDKSLATGKKLCFGKIKWATYFGDIGIEPPLPFNINQILNSPCPFWKRKKICNTHMLVLVPESVNNERFTLNSLEKLIQNPKSGFPANYSYYNDFIKNELGYQSSASHWVLMTRNIIPGSSEKTYNKQEKLIASYAEKSGYPYELPPILDAATCIFIEYVSTGKSVYMDRPFTYTRCNRVKLRDTDFPGTIGNGNFLSNGLEVDFTYENDFRSGAACYWKLGLSDAIGNVKDGKKETTCYRKRLHPGV